MTSVLDEVPKLRDRHQRVVDMFASRGVDNLENVEACLEILEDVKVRAEFMAKLKMFLTSMGIVLPRPEALPYVKDMKRLGRLRLAAANRFRDHQLNLLGAAQKVRRMIDRHLVSLGIDPYIPAVSVLDKEFEKEIARLASPRAKASEMEHAVRHHIQVHIQEDPVRYRKLSERLEEILETFKDRWDDLLAQLEELTREVREGRTDSPAGLNPQTQAPFLDILAEEAVDGTELLDIAEATVELVKHLQQDISTIDFWRNAHSQDILRSWVVQFLDDRDLVPFAKQRAVADRLLELAKALHVRLTAS
jgi:type I restriction enzyme R subunit